MRRAVATALCALALTVREARADTAACTVDRPAPETGAPLVWKTTAPALDAAGWWYSDRQVVKLAGRIQSCETAEAKCLVDLEVAKRVQPGGVASWIWISVGVVVGLAAGFGAAKGL